MNSSSKVPPRFVPTLTEVVQIESSGLAESGEVQAQQPSSDADFTSASEPPSSAAIDEPVAKAFQSPWLADGLYARHRSAGIPRDLPPLPDSLPPQQSFARTEDVAERNTEQELGHKAAENLIQSFRGPDEDEEPVASPEANSPEVKADREPQSDLAQADESSGPNNLHERQLAEDQLVNRLMQRVDQVLDQRLNEIISQVLQEETQSMVARLREEVETAVRQVVCDAIEGERFEPKRMQLRELQ